MTSEIIQVLEIKLNEPASPARTDKVSRLMQKAGQFNARIKYWEEKNNCVTIGFVSDKNLEALKVMLQN